MISVIIPAHNEEDYITACLAALLRSTDGAGAVQVIVAANGCTDGTVAKARACGPTFESRGWRLDVLDLEHGGKPGALDAGDRAARYAIRAYIDADILVSPDLLAQLVEALNRPEAAYASGQPVVPPATTFLSDRYARFWQTLPFVTRDVPGFGVYAVNSAGRARWKDFPRIISDDGFVRHLFTAEERHRVPATYRWPIVEGLANLIRVRRRQDEGMAELRRLFPKLSVNVEATAPARAETWRLFRRDPIGFAVYAAVAVAVRLPVFRNHGRWDRGR